MSLLRAIQESVVGKINAHEYFKGGDGQKAILALSEAKKDAVGKIRETIAKIGACVIVGIARAPVKSPNLKGPRFEDARLVCACHENVLVNRGASGTGEPCIAIAEAVARLLHLWTPADEDDAALCGPLRVTDILPDDSAPTLSYQVLFAFSAGFDGAADIERSTES